MSCRANCGLLSGCTLLPLELFILVKGSASTRTHVPHDHCRNNQYAFERLELISKLEEGLRELRLSRWKQGINTRFDFKKQDN